MEAIVLAGGLGSRLRTVLDNKTPKPMAPIKGTPFLAILLDYLQSQQITHTILSIGYLGDEIRNYFGHVYKNMHLSYAREDEPLGTGGAILSALALTTEQSVFIVNGDTYLTLNYQSMMRTHLQKSASITIALVNVPNMTRYGNVSVKDGYITEFSEKKSDGIGLVNGGVYLLNHQFIKSIGLPKKFSFEKDFLNYFCKSENCAAYITDSYFIDIGVPEEYERAQKMIPAIKAGQVIDL